MGIPGIHIDLWSKKQAQNNFRGGATSDTKTIYFIHLDNLSLGSIFWVRKASLIFKALHKNQLVTDRDHSVLWPITEPLPKINEDITIIEGNRRL